MRRSDHQKEDIQKTLQEQYQKVKSAFPVYDVNKDPFINKSECLSAYGKSKFLFPGVVTIPSRFISLVALFSSAYIITGIAAYCRIKNITGVIKRKKKNSTAVDQATEDHGISSADTNNPTEEPLRGWRRFVSTQFLQYGSRLSLYIIGYYYIKVKGKRDPNAPILVCNHTGPYEGFLLSYLTGACFLSRAENRNVPFLGSLIRAGQGIFVDRTSPESRASTVAQIRRRYTTAPAGEWPPLVIFPEGTCQSGEQLLYFKPGAFQAGVPVQPCFVKQKYRSLDPCWSSTSHSILQILIRVLAQWYNSMEMTLYPTYYPSDAEKKDPQLYADNVRRYLAEMAGQSLSEYSVDDMLLIMAGEKCRIPRAHTLVGIESIRQNIGYVSVRDVKNYIKDFHEMDIKRRGKLSYDDFLRGVGINATPNARRAFDHLVNLTRDANHIQSPEKVMPSNCPSTSACMITSYLTFNNFLVGIITIHQYYATCKNIQEEFEIINISGSGYITLDEMIAVFEYTAPEITISQITNIFKSMDTRYDGVVDLIEFGVFMRAHPLHMIIFEESREAERGRSDNPILRTIARRDAGDEVTVETFREEVRRYYSAHINGDGLD
eukprot:Tbor_TRINITY_DN5917_c1_g8::TRINITY_DN5917_c1_g8_i1::g.19505::m.19505/K13510/LPCAT1_2; lysophosphatidylcholine acyltransferase / lyso-PAF acetyltransferase